MNNLQIDQDGLASNVSFIHSPNQDARPAGHDIKLIVIHNISLPPNEYGSNGVIELFTNQLDPDAHPYYAEIHQLKVSSHFFIRRDGSVIQFVPCTQRAWHAGASNWQGQERCNDFSIGIELEGSDFEAFESPQYVAVNKLVTAIKQAYPIEDIVGHSDIAPSRKTDPGPYFDWSQVDTK
ncbi:1,6-anhydro-N-acetylmuramyl-L-alanine amidase AmpD [Methyloradius palustris]|uniref:1,6-anhydro-N-acetylmuramyl-L-alanine amidase AmpD n=1 Tax=Methyloradius palustris TaxID=2778876 RepID=A0A8D5GAF0_9PROT|nr:1,6-anhydro-N-acetylmuramyl-L-alanine amidase AmpD [Methyloradius palustris]BCM23943.1 N-acetyl-anhydromuranmyl-L-alanine amidase [Methyloradius palustris]